MSFEPNFISYLIEKYQSVKLVIGWCGAQYRDISIFNSYDIILSNIKPLVDLFLEQQLKAKYFCHAFEPRILDKINTEKVPFIDFSFIGSINKGNLAHLDREKILVKLLQNTNLQIYSDVSTPSNKDIKLLKLKQLTYYLTQSLGKISLFNSILTNTPKMRNYLKLNECPNLSQYVDKLIYERSSSPLFGLEMFQCLYNSKVTFNNHINISSQSASNMRLFEATGVGTCLLTDWKPNLHELFEPDYEVVTYRSVEECIEKVKWLLDHPQESEAIAKAGQLRTLKDHTFAQRSIQLDKIIKQNI
jgi:hypothetical protein